MVFNQHEVDTHVISVWSQYPELASNAVFLMHVCFEDRSDTEPTILFVSRAAGNFIGSLYSCT